MYSYVLYITLRGTSKGPLFIKSNKVPVNIKTFRDCLKFCINRSGFDDRRYNTHSFRIGRATDLSQEGASDSTIKSAGRWTSAAFKKYIKPAFVYLPT